MSQKTILFITGLVLLLCFGMWRYAVLWQAEQVVVPVKNSNSDVSSESVDGVIDQ